MKFPWQKSSATLRDLVVNGIPPEIDPAVLAEAKRQIKQEARAKRAARQAAAEQKRIRACAARSAKCADVLTRLASVMTGPELDRWGKLIEIARRTSERMHTSSKDLKQDLSMLLPPAILQRAGLPVDSDNVSWTAPKDPWRSRASYSQLVKDESGEQTVTAQMIIDAAAKARGDVKPNQQIDPGKAIRPSERWLRK
jgi:hypothetical protein